MDIRYLTTDEALFSILPLISQHHTTMKEEDFTLLLQEMKNTDYQCIGCYEADKLVTTVGFWIGVRFYCGKYMYVNNFVVDNQKRGSGIGSQLVIWLEEEAKRLDCKAIVLDSYVTNSAAHKFYYARDYVITNFHFTKILNNSSYGTTSPAS